MEVQSVPFTDGDEEYQLHKFNTSGNFVVEKVPSKPGFNTMNRFIAGGGGSGGGGSVHAPDGAGGGAAVVRLNQQNQTINTGTYAFTVGTGGPQTGNGAQQGSAGAAGGNTTAFSTTANAGNGGGARGGSGGNNSDFSGSSRSGASRSAGSGAGAGGNAPSGPTGGPGVTQYADDVNGALVGGGRWLSYRRNRWRRKLAGRKRTASWSWRRRRIFLGLAAEPEQMVQFGLVIG